MAIKVTLELTDEQMDQIIDSRKTKKEGTYSFSIAKSARLIGISESTIHRRIKDGLITTLIMGKSPRITQQEIERYKNQNNINLMPNEKAEIY